jgi:type VII secretion integral membrane protein EccD
MTAATGSSAAGSSAAGSGGSGAAGSTPPAPAGRATPGGGAAVFSRVTVVAPRTRIDVALPSDVAVADLLPMLLEMARESTPDGGARHGGWALARLGQPPLEGTRTLTGSGVLDGELLQLCKRAESPPPPLFDDVIDAVALSTPSSYRPWTEATARALGGGAAVSALLTAAVALFLAGPGLAEAVTAVVAAVLLVAVGAVLSRVYRDPPAGAVLAGTALPLAFVAGLYAVPDGPGRPNLLLAFVAVVVFAAAATGLLGAGVTVFTAAAAAALLGAGASLVAVLVAHPVAGIAAGTAAVALVGLSFAPRLTIQLARLPLPAVPTTARELNEDDTADFPDFVTIERQAALGHQYLTGLVVGFGSAAAVGGLLAGPHGTVGVVLAATVAAVLMLRARTYANGVQAAALLTAGLLTAGGLVIGWMVGADDSTRLVLVFGATVLLGVVALVLGVVFPRQRFSPPMRRAVEVFEALLIAAVLPLALGVMDLYATMRGL